MERQTYTTMEIRDILGIGRDSAYKLVKAKGFPKIQIGRKVVIPKKAFENWLLGGAVIIN